MVHFRGRGRGGWSNQKKISLDEDAGIGFQRLEGRLLGEIFQRGYRSDVIRIMVRHFEEHPPDILWLRKNWMRSTEGADLEETDGDPPPPKVQAFPTTEAEAAGATSQAPLAGGGGA